MAEWDADIAITPQLVAGLISAQMAPLAGAPVEPFGQGWDNAAFLVDERWVFRFPRRAAFAASLAVEAGWLPLLAQHLPLRVSAPDWVGEPDELFPHTFCGYRMIEGETLCRVAPDDAGREALAAPLGAFLRALHDIPITYAMRRNAPGDTIRRADMPHRLWRLLERLEVDAAGLGDETNARIAALLLEFAGAEPHEGPPCWVHGDLYARHLILDGAGELAGIIDWGDMHLGDPALDLSAAFSLLPASARPAFFAAYGEVDAHTIARARFRALHYGILLTAYGVEVKDAAMEQAGRYAALAGLAEPPNAADL
jgi:aminoglycoside phosphotransferase (APT) family kinase protein